MTAPCELHDIWAACPQTPGRTCLIGVDGYAGSGKSTLARMLAATRPGAIVVGLDDFYRPRAQQHETPPEPGANYDLARFAAQVLDPLAAGRPGRYQRYDWDADALAEWHDVPCAEAVIIEGVYSTSAALRDAYALRIWVQAPYELRLVRGVARDGEAMRHWWTDQWMPAEDRYVRQQHPDAVAQIVLDGSGNAGGAPVFRPVMTSR